MSFNDWNSYKLIDIIQFNPKETIKKKALAKKIAMDKLETFTKKISGYEEVEFTSGTKFRNGDTLLARITPCLENGKTAQVDILEENEVAFGSTEYIVLREKLGITCNDFIYYLAISPEFRSIAIKSMTGSSGRQRVQKDVLEENEIILPPLEEQKAIAKILSDLDEKIETNNEINKNLEEMAQAIFKQWFVDFEFPDKEGKAYKSSGGEMLESKLGMIPKGWSIQDLNNIVDVKDGTHDSPKPKKEGYRLITSKHIKGNKILYDEANLISKEDYEKVNLRSKVDKNDILITMIGTVGNLIIVDKENIDFAIKNIGLIKSSQKEDFYEYLYLYLKSKKMTNHIISRLVGSTQKYISLKELRVIPVIVPSEDMKILFKKTIESIFIEIRIKLLENERLEKIRDTILPKLMSGEVRVSLK